MNNKKKSVTISFNITPEVAEALDSVTWLNFDSRASYVRDLLVRELKDMTLINHHTATTPAMVRARKASLARRVAA